MADNIENDFRDFKDVFETGEYPDGRRIGTGGKCMPDLTGSDLSSCVSTQEFDKWIASRDVLDAPKLRTPSGPNI